MRENSLFVKTSFEIDSVLYVFSFHSVPRLKDCHTFYVIVGRVASNFVRHPQEESLARTKVGKGTDFGSIIFI